jgi:long-subunit fatty acid transport protein
MSSNRTLRAARVIVVLVLLFSAESDAATLFQQVGVASSPNPVGSGARAMGMGGAFIAIADDATAASWNPAGLIHLERAEISIVGAYFNRREEFSSGIKPETNNTGEVDDVNINYISATYPFEFYKNFVVSVNYQRLYDFKRSFNHQLDFSSAGLDVLQSKQFEQEGFLSALGIAAAVEIMPRLSFGATLNIWTGQLLWDNGWDETFTERAVGTQGGVPVTIDTRVVDEYADFRGINFNVGMLWNVTQAFTLGAVIKTPFDANMDHKFSFSQVSRFGPPVNSTVSSQQTIVEKVELSMPLSYGLGLAWRVSDALSFDLDVYRTDWSDYILKDSRGNNFSPIDGRPEGESDVEDTTQVRLGGEYLFILPERSMVVPIRAGLFYDPEPSQGDVKDFYGLAFGSGIAHKRFVFDLAYQFRWGRDIDTGNLIATSEGDVTQHAVLASLIIHF